MGFEEQRLSLYFWHRGDKCRCIVVSDSRCKLREFVGWNLISYSRKIEGPLICASKQGQDIIFKNESNCITLLYLVYQYSVFCFFNFLITTSIRIFFTTYQTVIYNWGQWQHPHWQIQKLIFTVLISESLVYPHLSLNMFFTWFSVQHSICSHCLSFPWLFPHLATFKHCIGLPWWLRR